MSNANGLVSSRAVCLNGSSASNIYLRKGDPIPTPSVTNNITIVNTSDDTSSEISQTGAGATVIYNSGTNIELQPANGDVVVSCNSTNAAPAGLAIIPQSPTEGLGFLKIYNGGLEHWDFSVAEVSSAGRSAGDLQLFAASQAGIKRVLDANLQGSAILLGDDGNADGCIVQIAGVEGPSRLYDETYNPPPMLPLQMKVDPAASVALLLDGTSSTTVKGSFKLFTLDAVAPGPEQSYPSIYLGGVADPGQIVANVGDTYGIKFTSVTAGSRVGIFNPDEPQTPDWTLEPVANEVYWFVCNVPNQFLPVGTMTPMPFV